MAPMTYAAADAPLSEVATEAKPLDLEVNIDGKPWKSDLISVDVLNIPFTGPALPLAHNADPGDTLLDVVGFESDKRDKLLNGLTAHRKACPAPLRSAASRSKYVGKMPIVNSMMKWSKAKRNGGRRLSAAAPELLRILVPAEHPAVKNSAKDHE
jgi:hypothetical protein